MEDLPKTNIDYVYEYCTFHIDSIGNSLTHKFYDDEYQKIFILGKIKAYEDIVHLIDDLEH